MAGAETEQRRALLAWYEPRRRAYPWRRTGDPYAVLVSEVMLQQTQAPRVSPAFERFLARFATVGDLARASRAEVIDAWGGLGHNRRAVFLSLAAGALVARHGGRVPDDPSALRALPGIGRYTAAAVASIAFGRPVAAVDTNVRRIVSRVFGVDDEREVDELASRWVDPRDPGAWNQALMDLGRETCRPRPRCATCPLVRSCRSAHLAVRPAGPRRREPAFEGSTRQLRGAVVSELRRRRSATLAQLSSSLSRDVDAVAATVRSLRADGLLHAGAAALSGRPSGRVRLH